MKKNKVIIIAEAGVNHNGDINLAKQLIDIAAEAKADYVKFQTWVTEELVDADAPKADYQKQNDGTTTSQYEMLKQLELSFSDFIELKKYCAIKKTGFLSTPDDFVSLNFLADKLNLKILKVGSGEVTNLPFLKAIGKKKRDVILSTGMSTLAEVKTAYSTLKKAGAKSISLLHCTSNYPADFNSVNLRAINHLAKKFNAEVGYSDHTLGSEISVAAVALGAKIIEKHFTTDKNLPGPDHKASLNPEELISLVNQIRHVESALAGSGKKEPHKSELQTKKIVQKGIYLRNDVLKGEKILKNNLLYKRPVQAFSAAEFEKVIGRKAKRNLKSGQALNKKDIA